MLSMEIRRGLQRSGLGVYGDQDRVSTNIRIKGVYESMILVLMDVRTGYL